MNGDICIDFRENSEEEIYCIKDFFQKNGPQNQWIRKGNLTENCFYNFHHLSFTSIYVNEETKESIINFLKEMVSKNPSICFKGLICEESQNFSRELKILKEKTEKQIRFECLYNKLSKISDLDFQVMDLMDKGYSHDAIAQELGIDIRFI
ncbi:hypothetical protein [Floccifex sp.]|uniref:hypothetical protein n=1 Tax=Floccifex sp. TaxID=2815810 RepID=UPI003F0FF443